MLCLTGVFEIVQTLFAGDLLQRAAHRMARIQRPGRDHGQRCRETWQSLVRQAIDN